MQSFKELKPEIRQHLASREVFDAEEEFIQKYKLSQDQLDSLQGIIKKVALKQMLISEIVVALVSVGISPNDAKAMTEKIVTSHFIPFKDFYEIPIQDSASVEAEAKPKQELNIITALVKSFNLDIIDELSSKRLYNVIDSRLREVRTPQQFKDILSRPVKVGGLGFEADRVDMICKAVEKELASTQSKVKIDRPAMGVAISEAKLPSTTKSAEPVARFAVPKSVLEKARAGSALSAPVMTPLTLPKQTQKPTPKPQDPEPPALQIPIIVKRPAPSSLSPIKEVIHDVKSEGVPLNLVDELSLIDLNEFRKIGLENLKAKIDSLAKESYGKKIAGIGAWRKSPVYKMYTELGNLSLETGSVEESVKARRGKGLETLTQEEFNAISEFNTSLLP